MRTLKRLAFISVLLATTTFQFAEMRTWTDMEGNTREAELVNAFGPMAYFMDAQNSYTPFRISQLCEADQRVVEAFKSGITPVLWKDSDSVMSSMLRGRLFTYKDGKTENFVFGPQPEPDFYVLYFVGSSNEKGREFSPKLVSFYNKIKLGGFENFEIILVSQDRNGANQKQYMEEMGITWPAIKWSSRKWLGELMAMRGKGDVNLVIVDKDRHILQRTMKDREDLQPANLVLYINNLLFWTNPENPQVVRFRFSQLLEDKLAENSADSPPRAYQCSLQGIDFAAIPGGTFKIQMEVAIDGSPENVEVITDVPEAVQESILETASGWLFIPRIKDGQYVKSTIAFPVRARP